MIITSAGIAVMFVIAIAMDNVWGFVIGLLPVVPTGYAWYRLQTGESRVG